MGSADPYPPPGDQPLAEGVWNELRAAARAATDRAYAPYSKFHVGAAAITTDGRLITGSNIENASYGLTLCAECSLISDLARMGGGTLKAVVVVSGSGESCTPCGRCRQLLFEHGGPECLFADGDTVLTVGDLLPGGFGPERIGEG